MQGTTRANHKALKAYHREHRTSFPINLDLRVHRALSWLDRAEQSAGEDDSHFIFMWIAFNAAYANNAGRYLSISESKMFARFWKKLCDMDVDKQLYNLVWERYSGKIRLLLDNHFVYQPFWDFHNGDETAQDWEQRFQRHRRAAQRALAQGKTAKLLSIIFASLYTLRNQLIHGGATWNGKVNREQVKLGANILADMVPVVIELMMKNPKALWGEPCYPVVSS